MNCEHEYEFAERLAEVEQLSKSITHRIESVEKSQEALNQIATSVAVMAEQQKNISQKLDTIDAKVDAIESKPGKRWEGLVDKLIAVLAGAFLAWLVTGASGL